MGKVKKQYYVPQFLVEKWVREDSDSVYVYDYKTRIGSIENMSKLFQSNFFYENEEQEIFDHIEQKISEMEQKFQKVIDLIISKVEADNQKISVLKQDIAILKIYYLLQQFRSEEMHKRLLNMNSKDLIDQINAEKDTNEYKKNTFIVIDFLYELFSLFSLNENQNSQQVDLFKEINPILNNYVTKYPDNSFVQDIILQTENIFTTFTNFGIIDNENTSKQFILTEFNSVRITGDLNAPIIDFVPLSPNVIVSFTNLNYDYVITNNIKEDLDLKFLNKINHPDIKKNIQPEFEKIIFNENDVYLVNGLMILKNPQAVVVKKGEDIIIDQKFLKKY